MIKIPINPRGKTDIGRIGENEHRVIVFRESAPIFAMYPTATVTVLNQRPGDPAAYPVNAQYVQIEDGVTFWTVQSGDLARAGNGKCELVFTENGKVAKTLIYDTEIQPALDGDAVPPAPWESWVNEVTGAVQHYPVIRNGNWWVWDVTQETFVDTGVSAKGDKGDPGDDYVITQEDVDEIAETAAESSGIMAVLDEVNQIAYGKDKDGNPVGPDNPHYENSAEYYAGVASAAAVHEPTIGNNGHWFVWDQTTGQYVDTQVEAQGPQGETGQTGAPGVVQDVQIDGTSILDAQGVVNIPLVSGVTPGAVKTSGSYGIDNSTTGYLRIKCATETDCKQQTGSTGYQPITVFTQHAATFYGLAKAAGDSTQSASSNAVGTYTDEAINAILTMLGVYNRILTPSGNTHTLLPCPFSYSFGEKSELTVTVTATSQYHFMFSCPSASATVLTISGITGTMGDTVEAGKTYMVSVWAGIALIKECEVTAVT